LTRALRRLMPTGIPKSQGVSALGLKNKAVKLADIWARFEVLREMQPGNFLFNWQTQARGLIREIDQFTGEICLNTAAKPLFIPLAVVLTDCGILQPEAQFLKIVNDPKSCLLTVSDWRQLVERAALTNLDDNKFKKLSFAVLVPPKFTPAQFDKWWQKQEDSDSPTLTGRHPADARSLHELHSLLNSSARNDVSAEDVEKLAAFFKTLKTAFSKEELIMLGETVAILGEIYAATDMARVLAASSECNPLWPGELSVRQRDKMLLWGQLSSKSLNSLAKVTNLIKGKAYSAELCLQLPLKCWAAFTVQLNETELANALQHCHFITADAVLWAWRQRKKLPPDLKRKIIGPALFLALDIKSSGDWNPALNQLHKLLMDNRDFQQLLLANVSDNEASLMDRINECNSLSISEKQSLLVKLSRLCGNFKSILEKGEGKGTFAAAARRENIDLTVQHELPRVTSIRAYRLRAAALDNLINKEFPENTAAIAHARSYGDLRENAEYKAAKERQLLLTRRQQELEVELNNTQASDFSSKKVTDHVIVGSVVSLTLDDDEAEEIYTVLGVWDGAPEKHHISFDSRMGQVLMGKNTGDKVKLPDGRPGTISGIEDLPEALRRELADE